jgi:phosphate transport system permease protein
MSDSAPPPRAKRGRWGDRIFRALTFSSVGVLISITLGIVTAITISSWPTIVEIGPSFLFVESWDPVVGAYGALGSIVGTLVSTLIALLIAVPMGLSIAFFLVELAPKGVEKIIGIAIELLAAVPSIIYGMWGLFVFSPFMADYIQPFLKDHLGFLPLFTGPPMGIGMLTAGIILAFMVLPFITAVIRDVFRMVPPVVKEAAVGMGATTFEMTSRVTIPYGFSGIVGAVFLGLGRAVGETMAVTFVIGNRHEITSSLFAAGASIASTLANEFTEASDPMHLSALIELGLVLFIITSVVQILAQMWIGRTRYHKELGL